MFKTLQNHELSYPDNIKKYISTLYAPLKEKKSTLLKVQSLSLPILLSACTSGSGGTSGPKTAAPPAPADFIQTSDNVFVATSDDDLNLDASSSTQNLVVSGAGGDDVIIAGSGDDVIRAGAGNDNVKGGDGDDTIVLVGTTTNGQYSASSITGSAGGANLSSVLTEDDLNNNTVSEVGAGEVIDGGSGNDSLVIYGTAYINQAKLKNLDEMWVNSEVILTGEQFAGFGAFKGDGSSIIRVRADYLDAVTSGTDDNKGGNNGHGNNTDGQDDNNPGQGDGGPNFRDKDGVDEDENGGGGHGGNDNWDDPPIGGDTNQTPTIVDISDIYMANIGVLSLEGLITLIADDMHDFAGITNVNGDGSTRIVLNGDDDVSVTTFDLSEVNLSGIAELDLNGSFNLVVSDANDYFGIGSIAVSNSADITLTIDSTNNSGAIYNFSDSPLLGVDQVKTYGNTTLIFDSMEDFDDTVITSVTGSLTISFVSTEDLEFNAADLSAQIDAVDYIDIGANSTIIFDATDTLPDFGSTIFTGDGTLEIYRIGVTEDEIANMFSNYLFESTITVVDQNGNNLSGLVTFWNGQQEPEGVPSIITGDTGNNVLEGTEQDDTIIGLSGDDQLSGNGGNDTFQYSGTDFGIDTITDLNEGDVIDFSSSQWSYGSITTYYRENSVELHIGENKIILENFDGVLTNIGTYSDPILAVMSEEQRLDANHEGDVRPISINEIITPETVNLDENIRFYIDLDVSDDISGADYLWLRYEDAAGDYFIFHANNRSDFEGWMTLNEWFMPGSYNLVSAYGYDVEDNYFYHNANDLLALGLNDTIEVTNSNPDLFDPNINSISLDKTTLDLNIEDELFITLDAIDEMSGVDYVQIKFTGPTGQYQWVYFHPENGMVTELDINEFFASGTYTVTYAKVRDNAGHDHIYTGTELSDNGLDVSFELINPNADITDPNLTSITSGDDLTYIVGVNDQLLLNINTDENHSGLDYAQLYFTGPNGLSKYVFISNYSEFDGNINHFIEADLWPEGTYTLTSVYLRDNAQNNTSYNTDQLAEEGISFSFDVVAPLKIYGTVENDLLIGGDGNDLFIVGNAFGHDTIEGFTVGQDYIDFKAANFQFDQITQTINADGLLLEAGDHSVLVNGLTQTLSDEFILTANTAPAITDISLNSTNIDATNGASVNITLIIDDANNDVDYGHITFRNEDNEYITINFRSENGFSTNFEFDQWAIGTYEINYAYIRDDEGGYTNYNTSQLSDMGINTTLTITNDTPDIDMPVLTDFTISTTSIEVGIENVLNFEAAGSDSTSGISRFVVGYTTPDGTSTTGTSLNDEHQFIGGTTFSDWSDVGAYTISYVDVYDFAGNSTRYETADLDGMGFQTTFEVTDARVDNTAPAIENITLNQPYLDMGNNDNDTLFAEFNVNETGSGFNYGYVTVRSEDNSYAINSSASNSLTTEIYIGYGSTGIYDITNISLYDIAGNVTNYNETELVDLGLNLSFRVLGDGSQPGVEVSGTADIDTIIGTTADEVFSLHLGEDTLEMGSDWGHDTILDFIQGDDVLDFSATGLTFADLDVYNTSYGLFLYDETTGSDLLFQNYFGELGAGDVIFAETTATSGNDQVTAGNLQHLNTGLGDDTIEITDDQFNSVDGGAGFDTLIINTDALDGIGQIIDLSSLVERDALMNLEAVNLTNGENDAIALSIDQVLSMTDADNVLTLEGETGDIFNVAADGWVADGVINQNGSNYNQYTSGDATLLIDQEMTVI